MMDLKSLDFSYSTIAASVIYHFSSADKMERCTGFSREDVDTCVRWMSPHAERLLERGLTKQLRSFKRVIKSDWHNIQTHETKLDDVLSTIKSTTNMLTCSKEIKKKQVLESVNSRVSESMEEDSSADLLATIKPSDAETAKLTAN